MLEHLIGELSTNKKKFQSIYNILNKISRLDKNRQENIKQLKLHLAHLENEIKSFKIENLIQNLEKWLEGYKETLVEEENEFKRHFGIKLEEQLKTIGLTLTGHYPDLKAGLFTIELDFDKNKATIWFGPKQEKMCECKLTPQEIKQKIEKIRKELGSKLTEEQAIEKLRIAYERTITPKEEKAPIIKVLSEMAHLVQDQKFYQDPKRENYKSYSRADFSYDLFRIQKYFSKSQLPFKIHLITASRAQTKQRSNFLWVPSDENGEGNVYAYITIKEAQNNGT